MLRVDLDHLQSGMKLALPVRCRHSYKVLLNAGVVINQQQIDKLKRLSSADVYVFCPDFANYPGQEMYQSAVAIMYDVFQSISAGKMVDVRKVGTVIDSIVEQLHAKDKMLVQLAKINDADSYSVSHCVNVCIYSLFIGTKIGLKPHELKTLGLGALLHDIGKLRIPDKILSKVGKLTDQEFSIIKNHSRIGYRSLNSSETMEDVRVIVRDHHEKCDGSGYPNGITADKITFLTKIVTVADIYDAVTADRAYRAKMLPHEGMEILMANYSAGKIDGRVVETFTREVICYPVGCVVRLSTGELGRVVDTSGISWRPKVAVVKGKTVSFIDLAVQTTIFIEEIVNYRWVV